MYAADELDEDIEALPLAPSRKRPNRAASKSSWRQEALFELDDLGDLYDIDRSRVKLR